MDLTALSASDLSAMIAQREVSSSAVMSAYLDRIEAVNPQVNAITSLRARADLLAEAAAADATPRKGWLHGMPFAVKDLLAVKGLPFTQGSPIHAARVAEADSLIVARIRQAGAIVIGKTNTPEWGHGSHSFNPVFGVTRNPYDPSRSAGGSSGGAAAGLAARLLPVADGSDMMGSLRNPAAFCNVYGFRPTWGLVPDIGQNGFLDTLSTEGPMARSVLDLALLLETMAGPDAATPFGRPSEPFAIRLGSPPHAPRIGWLGDWGGAYETEPGILELCESALAALGPLNPQVDRLDAPFPAADLWKAWTTLRAMLNAGGKRAYSENPAQRALLKPETLWEIEQGLSLTASDIYTASVIRAQWYARAASLFDTYDFLAMPAAQVWPFPADWRWPQSINGRAMDTYHRWMEIVVPVSLIGLPSLCLPAGFGPNGLPMGVQIFGPTGSDASLLALGHAYHLATDWPGKAPPPL
jgi:amidase